MTHIDPISHREGSAPAHPPSVRNTTGSVHGASVQAVAVHGDIHIHLARSTFPAPRHLPPASRRFANRHRELARLDDALAHDVGTGPTVVVLHGLAGMGKTALALTALSRWTERFPDGQMYADLTHPAEVPPADVLGQFLRALGVALDYVPAAEAERAALWRTISAQRHLAVLLEAPASTAQVRPLLPTSPHSLTVITSQRPLHGLAADGAHLIAVEPLDTSGSLELLRLHLGADRLAGHYAPAHELARLCGGLPLALSVAAAQTAARPHRALSHTVLSLRRAHNRLELLSMHDFSTQASLDAAYRNLDEPAARAYRALGLIPGQDISCELAAAALNTDLDTADWTLGELVDTSLLTELNPSHYRFHDLVREHARHTAADDDSPGHRADTRDRILRWYLHATRAAASTVMPARRELAYRFFSSSPPYYLPAGIDHYDTALAWLDHERRNLDAAVRDAATNGLPALAILLADAMQPLAIIHKDDGHTIAVDEVALTAAQDAADPTAANTIRKRLARAYAARGDIARAREHVEHALRDTQQRGDQRGYASALKSQALLLVATGHPRAAVECFTGVVSILRDLGRQRAEGLALINLADTLLQLDRSMEAAIRLERARTLLSTLDQPDPYNAARAELSLARAHIQARSHAVAETMATTALATMTRLGSHHQQANAHDILAELAEQAGHHQHADEHRAAAAELRSTHTPPEPDDTPTATDPPANPG